MTDTTLAYIVGVLGERLDDDAMRAAAEALIEAFPHSVGEIVVELAHLHPDLARRIVDDKGKAVHPTQKPVALMERLILPEFRTVADPFMGLGTTLVACVRHGRAGIGIEREPKFFDIACRRVEEAYRQPRLWPDAQPGVPDLFASAAGE